MRSRRAALPICLAALMVILGILAIRVIASRGGPPDDLSAGEAVELARFQGWNVNGALAYVPQPREALVSDMSRREARDFLQQIGVTSNLPSGGVEEFFGRTFVVVVHGTVTNGPTADSTPRGEGLALVVDVDGAVRLVAIGPPWDTVIPPHARAIPLPEGPSLADVSRARARVELGGEPLVELASPPGGLSLRRITINREGLPVDPTATAYPGRSVTLSYADNTGRPRLWLSQSTTGNEPHVLGRLLPALQADRRVTHYAWYAGSWEIDGFVWHRDGRALYLTAEPGADLPLDEIMRTVTTLADTTTTRATVLAFRTRWP